MKKNILLLTTILLTILLALSINACSERLEDVNINPTRATSADPHLLLANCQQRLAGESLQGFSVQYGTLSCVVQHLAPVYHTEFDVFRPTPTATDRDVWQFLFAGFYNMHSPLRIAEEIIEQSRTNADFVNVHSAARILRVVQMQRITDLFGDVPYTEAGKGSLPGTTLAPKYDTQEAIYTDMLKELKEAAAAFDGSKRVMSNDAVFQGDLDKWRRFANTLRLRLAMRISTVAPALARQHGEEALRGGLLRSNSDNAYTNFIASSFWYRNTLTPFAVTEDLFTLSETLVERMKASNDPRLQIFSDKMPAVGLPNGLYFEEKKTLDSNKRASRPSKHFAPEDFSGVNMILCAAEAEFLQAEAAVKGWTGTQSAQTHYERGVRSALAQYSVYPENPPVISASAQDAYLRGAEVVFTQSKALEQIHTQKWLALFLDGYEPYAEYRRTGFPRLKPASPRGNVTGGAFPVRLLYPPSEFTFNKTNVDAAVQRAGAGYERMTAPVWWDK
ncbi:MAG: SusD/RagB family nutrient-binding outer membrane lipoprotein [Candidatus Kapaibacterium sp.]|nr:MAG: SusD/RagB family nutrient-binding outer membrane lipoprotein [Candidatus Kapabacteria bacterium]